MKQQCSSCGGDCGNVCQRENVTQPAQEEKKMYVDRIMCGVSRAEWHDRAWELYQAKAFDDCMLPKNVSIHTLRTIFNATYDSFGKDAMKEALAQPVQEPIREVLKQVLELTESMVLHCDSELNQHDVNVIVAKGIEALGQPMQESDLQKKLEEALSSLDFYRRRVEALQQWQSKMRDPERTIVCDILANGHTLEPAGDRYTAPPQPVQEPVGEVVEAVEGAFRCEFTAPLPAGTKLYTAPPERELIGLTDEEKADLVYELFAPCSKEENNALYLLTTYYANNAFYLLTAHYNKLKEKNT